MAENDILTKSLKILDVEVTRQEKRQNPKSHIVYRIEVEADLGSWFIYHRYSDFCDLHDKLKKVPQVDKLKLPPKETFKTGRPTSSSEEFIESRKHGLDKYIKSVLKNVDENHFDIFKEFLGVGEFIKLDKEAARASLKKEPVDFYSEVSMSDFCFLEIVIGPDQRPTKAIKVYRKGTNTHYVLRTIEEEYAISFSRYRPLMQNLENPFIVPTCYCIKAHEKYFMLKPFVEGTSLLRSIGTGNKLSHLTIKLIAAQLILAVEYLHSRGIVCMDIDLQNVIQTKEGKYMLSPWRFLKEEDEKGGTMFLNQNKLFSLVPEVIEGSSYSKSSDWWLFGLLLYQLFTDENLKVPELEGQFSQVSVDASSISPKEASDLVEGLLCIDPRDRLGSGSGGAQEIKSHPFFGNVNWKKLTPGLSMTNVFDEFEVI